jgi:large subunit ribosomal protein L20
LHKALLKHAKGFRGRSKNCFSIAVRRVEKSWQYAYRDRRRKKREYKKVWIQRISAGVRQYAWRYSEFMHHLYSPQTNIRLDRKVLANLAATEPFAFKSVVDVVQEATGVYKEPATYDPEDESWDFEDHGPTADDYYFDEETEEWKLKENRLAAGK